MFRFWSLALDVKDYKRFAVAHEEYSAWRHSLRSPCRRQREPESGDWSVSWHDAGGSCFLRLLAKGIGRNWIELKRCWIILNFVVRDQQNFVVVACYWRCWIHTNHDMASFRPRLQCVLSVASRQEVLHFFFTGSVNEENFNLYTIRMWTDSMIQKQVLQCFASASCTLIVFWKSKLWNKSGAASPVRFFFQRFPASNPGRNVGRNWLLFGWPSKRSFIAS